MRQSKPTIIVDPTNFTLVRDATKIGVIQYARQEDMTLLSNHFEKNLDSLYCCCSGIPLPENDIPYQFFGNGPLVGVEWVRHEGRPSGDEPECNNYRYVFGLSADKKKCWGMELTSFYSGNGQVADHWGTLDDMYNAHFPNGIKDTL